MRQFSIHCQTTIVAQLEQLAGTQQSCAPGATPAAARIPLLGLPLAGLGMVSSAPLRSVGDARRAMTVQLSAAAATTALVMARHFSPAAADRAECCIKHQVSPMPAPALPSAAIGF